MEVPTTWTKPAVESCREAVFTANSFFSPDPFDTHVPDGWAVGPSGWARLNLRSCRDA